MEGISFSSSFGTLSHGSGECAFGELNRLTSHFVYICFCCCLPSPLAIRVCVRVFCSSLAASSMRTKATNRRRTLLHTETRTHIGICWHIAYACTSMMALKGERIKRYTLKNHAWNSTIWRLKNRKCASHIGKTIWRAQTPRKSLPPGRMDWPTTLGSRTW